MESWWRTKIEQNYTQCGGLKHTHSIWALGICLRRLWRPGAIRWYLTRRTNHILGFLQRVRQPNSFNIQFKIWSATNNPPFQCSPFGYYQKKKNGRENPLSIPNTTQEVRFFLQRAFFPWKPCSGCKRFAPAWVKASTKLHFLILISKEHYIGKNFNDQPNRSFFFGTKTKAQGS